MRLQNKVILVTGSTTGIGQAIARRCAAEGACVIIHGRNESAGRAMAASLGASAAFCPANLADPSAAPALVNFALATFGRLDGLVNNAADTARGNLQTTTVDLFDRIIATNLRAPLLLIQAAFPHLKQSQGSVLNIGSVNAYCGEPNLLPYSVSKGGLMTLTRNLADALAFDHVRVNQMNVGWTITANENKLKISEGLPPDWADHPPL
ncbi:MAG TPA: SDR family NAD(P)-dependent oxidoreductase, partial [Tepidisphaeraceae bacterium]|nr:SDR family NAD(P)-dependent oxidoreductase [Tepidisphaeraceae bacterium]